MHRPIIVILPTNAIVIIELGQYRSRFNKIAIQGAPHMAVDKEAISLSRIYSLFYMLPALIICVTCLN